MRLTDEEFERLEKLPYRRKQRLLDIIVGAAHAGLGDNNYISKTILREIKQAVNVKED